MSEASSPACWPSILVLVNKFSHGTEVHPGLVPRLSHLEWQKQSPSGLKNQECSNYGNQNINIWPVCLSK